MASGCQITAIGEPFDMSPPPPPPFGHRPTCGNVHHIQINVYSFYLILLLCQMTLITPVDTWCLWRCSGSAIECRTLDQGNTVTNPLHIGAVDGDSWRCYATTKQNHLTLYLYFAINRDFFIFYFNLATPGVDMVLITPCHSWGMVLITHCHSWSIIIWC